MNPNRFLALALFALLAAAPAGEARAQWEEANGYYGGNSSVQVLVDGSSLLVGNFYGLFKSTDDGETFSHPVISEADYKIQFASFGSLRFADIGGFFRSTDSGLTWKGFSGVPNMNCLLYYKGNLFDGSQSGGLYKSTDSGAHWNLMINALDTLSLQTIVADGNDLYAGTIHGVWRSTDGGDSWFNPRPPSVERVGDSLYDIDSLPEPAYHLAAIGNNLIYSVGPSGVFYSSDTAVRWSIIPSLSGNVNFINASNSEILVGSDSILFCSKDSGLTWTQVCNFPQDSFGSIYDPSSFAVVGSAYFCAGGTKIFRSNDSGKTWNALEFKGVMGINSIALFGDTLYAGSGSGIYKTNDNGATWSNVSQTTIPIVGFYDSILIGGLLAGGDSLFSSTDLGKSWHGIFSGSPNCVISIGSVLFVGTQGQGIFKSTDLGKDWTAMNGLSDSIVYSLAVDGNDLIAGAYRGIFRSEDGGESWSNISNGLPDSIGSIYWPVASEGPNIIAGFEGNGSSNGSPTIGTALFRSSDSGLTWNNVIGDSFSGYIAALDVIGSNVFAGLVYSGVQVSTDLGAYWTEQNTGFNYDGSGEPISNFAFCNKYVFALSNSGSLYRRPLSEMIPPQSAVAQTPPVSDAIRSYPNPFSQSTQITFTSQVAGYADVSVVNILGAPVAHLFSGELDAGENDFVWDASVSSPGSYWCVARMNGHVQTLAMSLLR